MKDHKLINMYFVLFALCVLCSGMIISGCSRSSDEEPDDESVEASVETEAESSDDAGSSGLEPDVPEIAEDQADSEFAASWQVISDYGFAAESDFWFAERYWDDSFSYSRLSYSLTGGTVSDEGDYFSVEAVFNKPVKVPADLQPGESCVAVINELTGEEKTFTAVHEEGTGAEYYTTDDGWECWTTNIDSDGFAELLEGSADRLDAPFYEGVLRIRKDAVTGAAVMPESFETVTMAGLSEDDWFNVLAFDEDGYVCQLIFEGD